MVLSDFSGFLANFLYLLSSPLVVLLFPFPLSLQSHIFFSFLLKILLEQLHGQSVEFLPLFFFDHFLEKPVEAEELEVVEILAGDGKEDSGLLVQVLEDDLLSLSPLKHFLVVDVLEDVVGNEEPLNSEEEVFQESLLPLPEELVQEEQEQLDSVGAETELRQENSLVAVVDLSAEERLGAESENLGPLECGDLPEEFETVVEMDEDFLLQQTFQSGQNNKSCV